MIYNLHEYFLPSDAVIIPGDYNCFDHHLDKFVGNFVPAKYLSVFRSTFSLSDACCKFHPRLRQCNWFNYDFSICSPLDKFLVFQRLMPTVVSCEKKPCPFSHHDFVYPSLNSSGNNPHGPGVWKFNNSLLNDSAFCEHITTGIDNLSGCMQHFPSVKSCQDFFKHSIRSQIIYFSKNKRRGFSHEGVLLVNDEMICEMDHI